VVTGHINKLGRSIESIEEGMCWETWVFREWNDCRKSLSSVLSDMLGNAWECHNSIEENGGCEKFSNHCEI
jgi:hypothetical protein